MSDWRDDEPLEPEQVGCMILLGLFCLLLFAA